MSAGSLRILCGSAVALALALAQDGSQEGAAPPAIAQWGIINWASRMPPQLAAGGIAPGSLIRIRGWRLGPAPLADLSIRIRLGERVVSAPPLSAGENEIEARVPDDAPLGDAMLQVVKNGRASLEWPVSIVPLSFGALARNGQGWGPGEITNADGAANSIERSARPGEAVTLSGTGLGAGSRQTPRVLIAGRAAAKVRVLPRALGRPGVDEIAFTLPHDTPEGCHVPVQVSSAAGLYSNAVTLAVSRTGGACADANGWTLDTAGRSIRLGTLALVHADLSLAVLPTIMQNYPAEAGFASFVESDAGAAGSPIFAFPPNGSCATYTGTAGLHSVTSPLSALQSLPGKPLDAGAAITIEGGEGTRLIEGAARKRLLKPGDSEMHNYWSVIGGRVPAPGIKEAPLFLDVGNYELGVPGGAGTKAFRTTLRVRRQLIWRNRDQVSKVDPAHGATVSWLSSSPLGSSMVLIVAMNVDSRSGALRGLRLHGQAPKRANFRYRDTR